MEVMEGTGVMEEVMEGVMEDMVGIVVDTEDMVDMEVAMVMGEMDISYTIIYLNLVLV